MSIKALQNYVRISKYAKYDKNLKRRESWPEQVARVMNMHREKYKEYLPVIEDDLNFVEGLFKEKKILGSQRALQFGGEAILKKHERLFNCCFSYCDRPRFFQECMFTLLAGCGVGFSVQKCHISKLPEIAAPTKIKKSFTIPDSIEGWGDAIGVLMSSYFINEQPFPEYAKRTVEFDYSLIRAKGAPLSHGAKAPGPEPLQRSIELIRDILKSVSDNGELFSRLRPIHCHDITMHLADSVVSGGIRRAALISLFSPDDEEMATAKTGDWFIKNPQRGRCNNSVVLLRNQTSFEDFKRLMENVKQYGEPGFIFCDDISGGFNPCNEINLWPVHDKTGESGFQFCNLATLNMKKCKNEEDFYEICKAAAILGTLQAGYTDFPYLGPVTEYITRREALLGVSMTGMMDNPDISLDPKIQQQGAKIVLDTNKEFAAKIKINPAARATALKPEGTSSCILGSASGIHPHHAKRYFRRIQANKLENTLQHFMKYNPLAVEDSVWDPNNETKVITFVCEVPDGAKTKNQVDAITLLENVKLTQQNWIECGTRHETMTKPWLRHAVSNTISVQPQEWEIVTKFIYENRQFFAGISLLPAKGDKDYPQAPFTTIYTNSEIMKEYGNGALLASGLIVDGLDAWDDNLWAALDCALEIGENLDEQETALMKKYKDDLNEAFIEGLKEMPIEYVPDEYVDIITIWQKKDWVRRFKQFADRYSEGDLRKTSYLLKDVSNFKKWLDLNRTYLEVPWEELIEEEDNTKLNETVACAAGGCELI